MSALIHDRGRGPEIVGTRITVYTILDYYLDGWHHTLIAAFLRISSEQVLAAVRYIEEHNEEVMAGYQKILDRVARGHPPELQAKIDANHEKFLEMVRQWREAKGTGADDAGNSRG